MDKHKKARLLTKTHKDANYTDIKRHKNSKTYKKTKIGKNTYTQTHTNILKHTSTYTDL